VVVLHNDGVLQTALCAELLADDLFQESDIVFLQPFVKELGGNLYRQNAIFQLHRFDRLKPGFEALRAYVVLDHIKAILPYLIVVLVHRVSLVNG
jgi:hypothetical protein